MSNSVPVVFINCRQYPFLGMMIDKLKPFETRSRDTLRSIVNRRVYLAETGRGRPVVRASAVIGSPLVIRSRDDWELFRSLHRVPAGSVYDWKPGTKVKYMYPVLGIRSVSPFTPPEGVRHGRVWMEYTQN